MASKLLGDFDEARAATDSTMSAYITAIDSVLFDALKGDRLAARSYATAFADMTRLMCRLVTDSNDQRWLLERVVRREAIAVPFRAYSVEGRPGLSVALTVLGDLRRMLPTAAPLSWPASARLLVSHLDLRPQDVADFERVVNRVLDAAVSPLEEIIETLDLSYTDAGRLFGVTRQAISHWLADGVPADRQAKIVTVAQTITLLRHYLLPARVPGVARKPAEAYGGRSMLEMIQQDEHEGLLELTRRSFDWARTA